LLKPIILLIDDSRDGADSDFALQGARETFMVRESSWFRLLGPATCLVLVLIFFGSVLFHDDQLSFRDAGHYYYPLYKLVQSEWSAGRWPPLWEPQENSGMPLLGNPTAAVLYPGKLIFASLAYPVAAKLYIVGHAVIAFATMTLALRWWGLGWSGTAIGALTYTFGAPIIFQYCNVIFLVGAAWLPLGFRAVDRWLRFGNRWGLLELAIVLALLTMGGDPQAAYLLGLASAAYALQLAWSRRRQSTFPETNSSSTAQINPRGLRKLGVWLLIVLGLAGWVVVTLFLAWLLPQWRPSGKPMPALPWMRWAPYAVAAGWAGLVALWWRRSRDRARRRLLLTMLLGLIGSAVLGASLSAAQLLPVAEFTALTNRAAEGGPHDIYPFSLDPTYLAEFVWPNVLGTHFPDNTFWVEPLDWSGFRRAIWVPSLYIGGLGLLLAISTFGFRDGPPWRAWMSGIVIVSILGSLGQHTSPIWLVRVIDRIQKPEAREAMRTGVYKGTDSLLGIGAVDRYDANPIRQDGYLRDGDGGFYWMMSTFLPGFRQFRYPSKMLTFACFALSVLAGLGWERILQGDYRRAQRLAVGGVAITLLMLVGVVSTQERLRKFFATQEGGSQWGPFVPDLAYWGLVRSFAHTAVLLAIGMALFRLAAKRPAWAGALAVLLVSADLAVANSRLILSSPQELYEGEPEALRIIREAERKDPADGPYRIHRMPIWNPLSWNQTASTNRAAEYTRWERDTLQPKYGITENVEYTQTIGVTELYDYEWFFGPFGRKARPAIAEVLKVAVDEEIVYYPRRAYDMWNTRYFILPQYPHNWTDSGRGYASFMSDVELIYPPPSEFKGPGGKEKMEEWIRTKDYQIYRNLAAYPRAWVVHDFRSIKGTSGLNRDNRQGPMTEMLFANDPIWVDPSLHVFDPHQTAWIDEAVIGELQEYHGVKSRGHAETVKVRYPSPRQAVLECDLESPGMVVLSDVYYPGWKLTVDGKPAPIYRANRLMRGAAVKAGKHTLVYTYDPESFRIGLVLSVTAILATAGLAKSFAGQPVSSVVADPNRS
jgi:hypothetical protein